MKEKFYSLRYLLLFALLSFKITVNAQSFDLDLFVENPTTGNSGNLAKIDQILQYTVTITTGPVNLDYGKFTFNIPDGTVYVPHTTTLDGATMFELNGIMPFANGEYLTPGGVMGAGRVFVITFQVRVTATGGKITGTALVTADPNLSKTSSVDTYVTAEGGCSTIWEVTGSNAAVNGGPFNQIKILTPQSVSSSTTIYDGTTGAYQAFDGTALPGPILTNVSAMAYDKRVLFFVNNSTAGDQDLCFVDVLNLKNSVVKAYKFAGARLEPTAGTGYNITRMTMVKNYSDGCNNMCIPTLTSEGYALTDNGRDLIYFAVDDMVNGPTTMVPVIHQLGTLINASANGNHDVLAETGGDIISDGNANLYLIPSSGNVYKINPGTLIATYMGTVTGMLNTRGINSVAVDADGNIYAGGNVQWIYKIVFSPNMTATMISPKGLGWTNGDFASCGLPVKPLRVATNGNTTESNSAVPRPGDAVFAKVQPNPFNKELNIQVQLNTTEVVKVRLIDFYGRTVYASSEKLGTGANSLHIPVPADIGSGMYVLELWAGNNRLLQKKMLKK